MKLEKRLNGIVSLAVLLSAIGLIIFMFVQSAMGIVNFVMGFIALFSADILNQPGGSGDAAGVHTQVTQWLQAVATVVILVKAYKVLMSYVKTHHLSIRYLLEINFTATSLELLFNEASYNLEMKIIFLVLGISSLLIYLIFQKQLLEAEEHQIPSVSD